MSIKISTYSTIEINCPHCREPNDVDDIEFPTVIDGTDISSIEGECSFDFICFSCNEKFKITPTADIGVSKC